MGSTAAGRNWLGVTEFRAVDHTDFNVTPFYGTDCPHKDQKALKKQAACIKRTKHQDLKQARSFTHRIAEQVTTRDLKMDF